MSVYRIRPVSVCDAESISSIYNFYVENTTISFEESPVSQDEMANRINEKIEIYPWLIYEENGIILGYAYLGKWKERAAYRFTVEDSIYVHHQAKGKGIGKLLFDALISEIRQRKDIHSIMGVISLPNESSVSLHEKYGFKKIAHFSEVGYKFGKWIDVGYWQIMADRLT